MSKDRTIDGGISLEGRLHARGGYAALVSVIIVSGILLLVVVGSSYRGYFGRSEVLLAEFKERSTALAEACIDHALFELARDADYGGDATVILGVGRCSILPILYDGAATTIRSHAELGGAHTDLRVSVDRALSVISWVEVVPDP